MTRPRTRIKSVVVALAAVALALAPALPAAAHDYVVSSTPEEGETLTAVPEFFVITTNEPMLDLTGDRSGFALQVTDASGLFYGDGCVDISGASMATPGALGAAGDYTLTYQYVSADGHTLSDAIAFRYEPADASTAQPGLDAAPTCGSAAADRGATGNETANPVDETATVLGVVGAVLAAIALLVIIVVIARSRGRRDRAATSDDAPVIASDTSSTTAGPRHHDTADHDGSGAGGDGSGDGGGGGGGD